jgi:signal transduction histidine kinase
MKRPEPGREDPVGAGGAKLAVARAMARASPAAPSESPETPEPPIVARENAALVLHDSEPTIVLLRSLLEAAGFEVSSARSALQVAAADDVGAVRFVVLGLSAVDDRHVEVVSILRRRAPDAWILVLHPVSLRERAAQALALGADASLAEPFYPVELTAHAARARDRTTRETTPRVPATRGPAEDPPRAPPSAGAAAGSTTPAPTDDVPGLAERLAGGVARSLGASLQALERQLAAGEPGDGVDVPAIRAEMRGLARLAEGLRRFAGHDGVTLRPTDVANLVTGVFMSRDVGAAGAEIGVRLGDARVEVLAEPDLLRAALEAVRNRAVRVTPPEGKISVRTRSRVEDGRRMVEISVTDGGPALTAEQRMRLFAPFPDEPGGDDDTGLEFAGLASIVREHRGSVSALAAGATGTIVVIRLPVSGAAAGPAG